MPSTFAPAKKGGLKASVDTVRPSGCEHWANAHDNKRFHDGYQNVDNFLDFCKIGNQLNSSIIDLLNDLCQSPTTSISHLLHVNTGDILYARDAPPDDATPLIIPDVNYLATKNER